MFYNNHKCIYFPTHVQCKHTVQPDTVGAFSTVDPVVGRIYVQCKY